MTEPSVTHATFVVQRTLPASCGQVFAAFAEADLKRRWFAEGAQHEVEEFVVDLREGAFERLRYRFGEGSQFAGMTIATNDLVLNVVPERRILWASRMTFGDKPISAALITAELAPTGTGTELSLTFQGAFFEGADGPQIREMGWQTLLERLAEIL